MRFFWISDVVLGRREPVLRACITSSNSDESDVDCLIEELEHARHGLLCGRSPSPAVAESAGPCAN